MTTLWLQLHIPDSGALFQFHQSRAVIKQGFDVLGLHFIISSLRVENFQQRDFPPVVAVYLAIYHFTRLAEHTVFIMFHLLGERLITAVCLHDFCLNL